MSTVDELAQSAPGHDKLPTGISRTILIGVGGTGKEVLTRVRKHIIQEFDSLGRVPVISCVQIDTDPAQPKFHLDKEYLDASKLKGNEMVYATLAAGDLGDDLSKHRHLADWLSPEMSGYQINQGAKQIRQLGRLAFFVKYAEIRDAIRGAFERATNPNNVQQVIDSGLLVDTRGLNVYVVGSLSGGTGSGMLLDVAFLCQEIVKKVEGAKVFGYLVLPEVFTSQGGQVSANAFAALKELDYFNAGNSLMGQYTPAAADTFKLHRPPFTVAYLVNGTNQEGVKLNAPQLFDMAALHIFTDFIPGGIGALNRSNRDNLTAKCDFPDLLKCRQNYMTHGVSRIFFPYERLMRACGMQLGLALLDHWLKTFVSGHQFARMKECVEDYCKTHPSWQAGDLTKGIIGRLTTLPNNAPMYAEIHEWLGQLQEELKTQNYKNPRDFCSQSFDEFEQGRYFDDDPHPEKWRGYPKQIHANLERRFLEYREEIDAEIARRVDLDLSHSEAGLSYTIQFLEVLEERLKNYDQRYKEQLKRNLDAGDENYQNVTKSLERLDAVSRDMLVKIAGGRNAALQQQMEDLANHAVQYFEGELAIKVLKQVPAFLDKLRKHLENWRTLLLEAQGTLTNVKNALAELDQKTRQGAEPGEIYDESDIAEFFDHYVPDGEIRRGRLLELHRKVTEVFQCVGFHQLPQRAREDMEFKERMIDALLRLSSEYFVDLSKVSLAERFYRKYPDAATQMTVLQEAFKRSAPYLQLESLPGYVHQDPSKVSVCIGIAGGNQRPPDPAFANLLSQIKRVAPNINDKFIMDLSEREKHQIIFIRERAAFPLRAIAQMRDYMLNYQDYLSNRTPGSGTGQTMNPPIHMIKDDLRFETFPGIFPPDEAKSREAKRAFVIGIAWGIFDMEGDTIVYRLPVPGLGIDERKVIGSMHEPLKAIQRLLTLNGDRLGNTALDQVSAKIQQKIEEARLSPARKAELHAHLQDAFRLYERMATEVYRRDHPAPDESGEGYKSTTEYDFCMVIQDFILETGLTGNGAHSPEPPAPVATVVVNPPSVAATSACRSCGKENPAQAKFCAFCTADLQATAAAQRIEATHCGSCRTELLAGAKICHMCGTKVPPPQICCGHCQAILPPDARFCSSCTQPVSHA